VERVNNDTPEEESKPKVEIVMPTSADMRSLGIQGEVEEDSKRPVDLDENYYRNTLGPDLGPAVYKMVIERQVKVAKCLKERPIREFMRGYFRFIERRARELGFAYEDVEVEGGVTRSGQIQITVTPKAGATPL
jgi:hypothetical protein